MARVTVTDCLEHVDNRFQLVLVAAKRARQLILGAEPMVERENDKPTVLALREIAEGFIGPSILEEKEEEALTFTDPQSDENFDENKDGNGDANDDAIEAAIKSALESDIESDAEPAIEPDVESDAEPVIEPDGDSTQEENSGEPIIAEPPVETHRD